MDVQISFANLTPACVWSVGSVLFSQLLVWDPSCSHSSLGKKGAKESWIGSWSMASNSENGATNLHSMTRGNHLPKRESQQCSTIQHFQKTWVKELCCRILRIGDLSLNSHESWVMTLCMLCPCLHQIPMSPLYIHMKPIPTESSTDGHCVEEREPKWCHTVDRLHLFERDVPRFLTMLQRTGRGYFAQAHLFDNWHPIWNHEKKMVWLQCFLEYFWCPSALFGPKMPLFGCTRTRAVRSSWGQKISEKNAKDRIGLHCLEGLLFMLSNWKLKFPLFTSHVKMSLYVQITAFSLTFHLEPITGIT